MIDDGRQIKAARILLGWTQSDLCRESGLSKTTIVDCENGTGDPRRSSLDRIEEALAQAGIVFLPDGVRLVRVA